MEMRSMQRREGWNGISATGSWREHILEDGLARSCRADPVPLHH